MRRGGGEPVDAADLLQRTQERFLVELRHHFQGWLAKVTRDSSAEAFQAELKSLRADPVYSSFGLATPEYALVRIMGRLSISIGRRLGEIYDKIPRFVTQARFNLAPEEVAPKVGGILQLDVCVPLGRLSAQDQEHVRGTMAQHVPTAENYKGVAIEIRYNFNPNDSARLRKDVHMAELLQHQNLAAVYLIFSTISPREEAIARLKRAGWTFLVGPGATEFMGQLIGMDIGAILGTGPVRKEVTAEMSRIMRAFYESDAMRETLSQYRGGVQRL
jgi:hypothetical protein